MIHIVVRQVELKRPLKGYFVLFEELGNRYVTASSGRPSKRRSAAPARRPSLDAVSRSSAEAGWGLRHIRKILADVRKVLQRVSVK